MFFLDTDREEDLWSTSSPQPEEANFQVFHVTSPATSVPSPTPESDYDDLSPPSSPQPRQTTALEWQIAAQENSEGVHYTREKFPSDPTGYLQATFSREPVQVEEGEKVVILDEVSEFALRVRVLRTGVVGVLPAWNVEGALERLARLNMMFNEVATCPKEMAHRERDATLSSLASHMHVHDRCISDSRLRITLDGPSSFSSGSDQSDSDEHDMDAEMPATPVAHPDMPPPQKRRKAVEFVTSPKRTVFRYLPAPEEEIESLWSSEEDSDGEAQEPTGKHTQKLNVEDQKWWWDGWEESEDIPAKGLSGPPDTDNSYRSGRPRFRHRMPTYVV